MKVYITRRIPLVAKEILEKHFEVFGGDENKPYPKEKLANLVENYDILLTTVSFVYVHKISCPFLIHSI